MKALLFFFAACASAGLAFSCAVALLNMPEANLPMAQATYEVKTLFWSCLVGFVGMAVSIILCIWDAGRE